MRGVMDGAGIAGIGDEGSALEDAAASRLFTALPTEDPPLVT